MRSSILHNAAGPRRLEEILELIPPEDRKPYKMRKLLPMLVDEGSLLEVQPNYGAALVTALAFLGGRNIQTVRQAPGRWDVRLSFPDAPALPYVLIAGGSGPRPGLLLPDGRSLDLGFDPLFQWTVANEMAPLLTGRR